MEKTTFFKQHADTFVIIGVNIGIAAFILSVCLSNMSNISATNANIAATNARIDTLYVMFYDLLKEVKK